MSEPQKKPGVAFWITVALVVVLVAYPLAWGPWMALNSALQACFDLQLPEFIRSGGDKAFAPVRHLQRHRLMPWPYQPYLEWWLKVRRWCDQQTLMRIERASTE